MFEVRLHPHGSGPCSFENVPVGPFASRSASRTGSRVAASTLHVSWTLLRSVAVEARLRGVDLDAGRLYVEGEGERDRVSFC
jgi:hypothetical protein